MKPFVSTALAVTVAVLTSCQSTGTTTGGAQEWLSASPRLERQVDEQLRRLPWSHGQERVELIHWLAAVGEPAYPQLLDLCVDPRPDVSGSVLAALGATGDSRLVDALHALEWPASMHPQVEFERARAYLRLGDWSELHTLIDGLESEELWTRAWCAQALEEVTHQSYEFRPRGTAEERAESVRQWRDWLSARQAEGLLAIEG